MPAREASENPRGYPAQRVPLQRSTMLAVLATLCSLGCRDDPKPKPMSDQFPSWIPLRTRPLPGHGNKPAVKDSPIRHLSPGELIAIAYKFHPQLGDPETYSPQAFEDAFWNSPEQIALSRVQRDGYARLEEWQRLCRTVAQSIPPVYTVADRTYPRYFPTYMVVIDAPVEPGSIDENHLVVHVSYLVPYYFYYELHSRRIDGLIQRDPLLYEVTPLFKDVLAAIEREIHARYGYWRMSPDIAAMQVPGIHINGYHDWDKHPPTLQDALFTPQRW